MSRCCSVVFDYFCPSTRGKPQSFAFEFDRPVLVILFRDGYGVIRLGLENTSRNARLDEMHGVRSDRVSKFHIVNTSTLQTYRIGFRRSFFFSSETLERFYFFFFTFLSTP